VKAHLSPSVRLRAAPLERVRQVTEQLEVLLRLQTVDMDLAELESRRESLPEKIEAMSREKESSLEDVAEREAALDETRKARSRRERDLEDANAKINDLRSKQLVIKTNAEYAALTHEIEFVKQEIEDIEESVLSLLEETEKQSAGLDEARTAAKEEAVSIDARIAELEGELGRLDEEIAVKRDERLRLSKHVDSVLLNRYDRILASKGDCAVVCVSGGACSGCYKSLPPQTLLEVKRAKDLIECEGCGRILYWSLEKDVG
jgi:uncharacterized protein